MLHLVSLLGLLLFPALAWTCSESRRAVPWRVVAWGLGLQLAIGGLVFWAPGSHRAFLVLNDAVAGLLAAADHGARFVFGPLAAGPGQPGSIGFVLAFQVLPVAVFFSALTAACYRLGLIQPLVRLCARLFHRTLRISGAESLASAANLFVGVESALVVRPYLERMTRSELLVLLTTGMATVASTVLGFYVSFFRGTFPQMAGHLISATLLSIPASIVCAKLLLPESAVPETLGRVPEEAGGRGPGVVAAVMQGAMDGLKLGAGIAAGLIALLGLLALADLLLAGACGWLGMASAPTLTGLLGWAFQPFAALLGIAPADVPEAARLLGTRLIATEVPAFQRLAELSASGGLSPRSVVIMSYALCGFAHIASVAIFVGGTAAIAPSRRDDLAGLGFKALFAATLATLMTGCVAGLFSPA